MKIFNDERDVFFQRRFGMFIHWGLYSIPGWHEQILWRTKTKRKDYEKLIDSFDPVRYDPEQWLDLLQETGMEYLCFTAKHHDGFCMWDTKYTDYNIMNTPYGKDVLKMLADACHRRDIHLSIYYSCPDWHHPNYPNMGRHHEMFGHGKDETPDLEKYYDYVKAQVKELCTGYGKLYQFFWDVNVAGYQDPGINKMIRELQPGILINDRGPDKGDYSTPERHIPAGWRFDRPTEACQALGRESWGYREDEDYYTPKFIMQSIDRILAMGGNYLLNAGPKPDGTIGDEYKKSFKKIGDWYNRVRESFEGAIPASDIVHEDSFTDFTGDGKTVRDTFLATRKGNTIYIHLCNDIQSDGLVLKPLDRLPRKAVLLNDGSEIEVVVDVTPWHFREIPYLRLKDLPSEKMAGEVMVIKLEFDGSEND